MRLRTATAMSTAHPYDIVSGAAPASSYQNLPPFPRWIERLPPRPQVVALSLILKIILHGRRVAFRTISRSDAIR